MPVTITHKDALQIAQILGVKPCVERELVLTSKEVNRLLAVAKQHPDKSLRVYATHSGIGFNTYVVVPGLDKKIEITDFDSW